MAASRSGSRQERNDDSLIVFSSDIKGSMRLDEEGSHSLEEKDLVFAISDGMGGGNAGDLASSLILERMAVLIPETFKTAAAGFYPDAIAYLQQAVKDVHEHINLAGQESEDRNGMAATLAMAWFSPINMYLANVGDSRIYRCRSGKTEQFSRDHTHVWGRLRRGEIQESHYRAHPRRSVLYQVIGGGHPHISPHFAAVDYQPGDRFLICSDGLIDGLWERQIANALAEDVALDICCSKMLKRAMENSGKDDTSLIVIEIE